MTANTEAPDERNALADRIEAADGPSRELDGLIEQQKRRRDAYAAGLSDEQRAYWTPVGRGRVTSQGTTYAAPAYTASIDAALSLVPVGSLWALIDMEDGPIARLLWPKLGSYVGNYIEAHAATPALALTAAALRAGDAND